MGRVCVHGHRGAPSPPHLGLLSQGLVPRTPTPSSAPKCLSTRLEGLALNRLHCEGPLVALKDVRGRETGRGSLDSLSSAPLYVATGPLTPEPGSLPFKPTTPLGLPSDSSPVPADRRPPWETGAGGNASSQHGQGLYLAVMN